MKDSDILAQARDLLSDPGAWTKGTWCKAFSVLEADGRVSHLHRYCVEGAILSVLGFSDEDMYFGGQNVAFTLCPTTLCPTVGNQFRRIQEHLGEIVREQHEELFHMFGGPEKQVLRYAPRGLNDCADTTHQDMLNLLDKGIASLEEQGK